LRAVDVDRGGVDEQRAADFFSVGCEGPAAFGLDAVEQQPADARDLQAAVGLDGFDHRAEGVSVGGERHGRQVALDLPLRDQYAFARARESQLLELGEFLLDQRDGGFGPARGRGRVQQADEEVSEGLGVDGR